MKYLYLITLVIISLLFNNCKKENNNSATNVSFDLSIYVDIAYRDSLGQDLLNSSTKNYFSSDGIFVFDVTNGIKTEENHSNYTYPRNFFIYRDDTLSGYFLRVFCETDTTLLQLNSKIVDTIVCTFYKPSDAVIITKVCYNGVLEWNNLNIARSFTIVK